MFPLVCALVLSTTPAAEIPASTFPYDPSPGFVASMPLAPPPVAEGGGADLSYTYIEAGFTTYDVEDLNNDSVNTYYARGSLGLFKLFYVFGEYENSSIDFQNTDSNQVTLGAGAHFDPSAKLSLFGQVGWIYNSVSSDDSSIESDKGGYRVDGGVRWMALPWSGGGLELDGGVGYVDLENGLASSEHPVIYDAGARVHFLGHFSVGAMYERIDVDDRLIGNLRFSF
jgi:hypothetical protein